MICHATFARPGSYRPKCLRCCAARLQVREEDAFRGVDALVKNFLVSVPLVADLRSPAMRDRHWQQLMDTTKVGCMRMYAKQHSQELCSLLAGATTSSAARELTLTAAAHAVLAEAALPAQQHPCKQCMRCAHTTTKLCHVPPLHFAPPVLKLTHLMCTINCRLCLM